VTLSVSSPMSTSIAPMPPPKEALSEIACEREELVSRVASSSIFEKSFRLRAFFLHVCRCALEHKPEEATEQQIGIHVYGKAPGYNPNEDNIVRSQARVLRMKLEHHFVNEGRHESVIITIPKGRYLPLFEARAQETLIPEAPVEIIGKTSRLQQFLIPAGLIIGLVVVVWLVYLQIVSKSRVAPTSAGPLVSISPSQQKEAAPLPNSQPMAIAAAAGEIRIAAGHTGAPYVDVWGRLWDADRYYRGGVSQPGPRHFFPPIADAGLFRTMRQAVSGNRMIPESGREFHYEIPLNPGVYELRLYFADPLRQPDADAKEDAQNNRHLQVNLNGRPFLEDLDAITDAGSAAVDVRAFRDISPAADGKLHLDFISLWDTPAFVSALALTPGTPGKMKPIRIAAQPKGFVDTDGTRWTGDDYFIEGRTYFYENPDTEPKIPAMYAGERHGNFSYAIPVAPGSYTVKLHFLESYFSPLIPNASCQGVGCRVFDVSCNGVALLQDFDIVRAAGGAFKPVVREFHGLHPNAQGKLLLSFSPRVNYAEIRGIEVLDEGK
jgi:Malectin domain